MKYLKFLKHSGSKIKILALDNTRARIEPYDTKFSTATHGAGSQVTSHSSGSPLGHTNLPQQSQYSSIAAYKYDPQAKLEQLKLNKTDPSTLL
jgi:hypothetical protein